MASIKQKIADFLLGNERQKLDNAFRLLFTAYEEGQYQLPPEELIRQLGEVDSSYLQTALNASGYDVIFGGNLADDTENERNIAIKRARQAFKYDPLTDFSVSCWTNFGFGETIEITPQDENPSARIAWDEFWYASRNRRTVGQRYLHDLSNRVLVDGEVFFVFFVSMDNGSVTVRTVRTDEIVRIIYHPDDTSSPLFYERRIAGTNESIYYPDWMVGAYEQDGRIIFGDVDESMLLRNIDIEDILPDNAARADVIGLETRTFVCMMQVAHNMKGGDRGWPITTSSVSWSAEHKRFRENRAAVAASVAMFVNKLKSKTGSRGVQSLLQQIQTGINPGGGIDTNPPPVPGSTFIGNENVDLSRLPLSTGASDAKSDGEGLLLMAGLGLRLYPHWLGAGDAYRLACYSDDTEVLTENGWRFWYEYEPGLKIATYNHDLRSIEYKMPTALHLYPYKGPMLNINGKAVDALVTHNHRMLAKCENDKRDDGSVRDYEVVKAEDLWTRFKLPAQAFLEDRPDIDTFVIPGHTYYCGDKHSRREVEAITVNMDDFLELLGWWLSEGCLHTSSRQVQISQRADSPYVEEIRSLLERTGIGFFERISHEGEYITWAKTSKSFYQWLETNCGKGAENKHLPSFAFELNQRQTKILLDAMWKGDGSFTPEKKNFKGVYTSVSKRLIDEVQILVLHLGDWGRAKLSYGENEHPTHDRNLATYRQNRTTRSYGLSLSVENNVKEVEYEGIVWCFEAPPNKMFITRRNGFPLIAGNTASAMEIPLLRNFSRYQVFWSSVWNDVVTLVLGMKEKYGGLSLRTLDVDISSDRLVENDLVNLAGAISKFYKDVIIPLASIGIINKDILSQVTAYTIRIMLQSIGVANTNEILEDMFDQFAGDKSGIDSEEAKRIMEIITESHEPETVDSVCPLCGHDKAFSYEGHKGLLVCASCEKTYDPEVEKA